MNIEIANRLVTLRKKNNLSQEALAEKLGISRQAVSKWERAEASPDTDNLIQLARLYHVSLDELLLMEEDTTAEELDSSEKPDSYEELSSYGEADSYGEAAGFYGEADSYGEAAGSNGAAGSIGKPDSYRNAVFHEEADAPAKVIFEKPDRPELPAWFFCLEGAPLVFIIVASYLVLGCFWDLWHPGWLLFLLLPVLNSLIVAIRKRNSNYFAYPVLVVLIYMILGLYLDWWHPGWLIFLTVPVYYPLMNYIQRLIREQDKDLGL